MKYIIYRTALGLIMATLVTVTYEILIEEKTKEQIEELIYQHVDVGMSHNADIIDLVMEEE